MSNKKECVKVVVRTRPINKVEIEDNRQNIIRVDEKRKEIYVKNLKGDGDPEKTFTFDNTFGPDSTQENVYKNTGFHIVESVLEGFNGTIFAYGQTGTGKTHTMEGKEFPEELQGIIPRTFNHIFKHINGQGDQKQYLVRASFLELYNEEIRDLLSKGSKKLEIRENPNSGIYIKDLSYFMIESPEDLKKRLEQGQGNRHVGETAMNRDSSRSHSIFSVTIEVNDFIQGESKLRMGKLNLVDLAGSERQSKTQAQGDRFKEAININQSLSTLGNVISALVDGKGNAHIPYRDSKLTRLLQDSLGGNTKTVMIANLGPADYNFDETLTTLRYANRAKSIKNDPHINEDPKDAMLRQFQEEIERLKEQLQGIDSTNQGAGQKTPVNSQQQVIKEKIIKSLDEKKAKQIEINIQQEKEALKLNHERELKRIEEQKNLTDQEKQNLLDQLKEKEDIEKNAISQQQKLMQKLKKMEDKLLHGSTVMEKALLQEKELAKFKQEIDERVKKEQEFLDEMIQKDNLIKTMQQEYSSQKEEIDDKTKKIKQLWQKLKVLEGENKDLDEMYLEEIEQQQQRRRELIQQLKYKNLIVEYFIPESELQRLFLRAIYNEDIDDWIYPNLQLAGNRIDKEREDHYQQEYNSQLQQMQGHQNVFFAYSEEGLIREEDMAPKEKSTKKPSSARKRPGSKIGRGTSAKKKKEQEVVQEQNFPKAKGLVKH